MLKFLWNLSIMLGQKLKEVLNFLTPLETSENYYLLGFSVCLPSPHRRKSQQILNHQQCKEYIFLFLPVVLILLHLISHLPLFHKSLPIYSILLNPEVQCLLNQLHHLLPSGSIKHHYFSMCK